MEFEVKLKLQDTSTHHKVSTILSPFHKVTHLQENVFFDGSNGELSAKRAVLRLHFYGRDSCCVVSLKGKSILFDGISQVEEAEEDLEAALGRSCMAEPSCLLSTAESCGLLKTVLAEYGCRDFVCLGWFRNVRGVFEWQGLPLKLDETHYSFGTTYEIKCKTCRQR